MILRQSWKHLAEMCYGVETYPHQYTVANVLKDFGHEVDLIRNEPNYIDDDIGVTRQFCDYVVETWDAANIYEQEVVIQKLMKWGVISQKSEFH